MVQLSPLVHMEMAVRDADAAFRFLKDTLGAQKVQEEFAGFLEANGRARVIHVGSGGCGPPIYTTFGRDGFLVRNVKKGSWGA